MGNQQASEANVAPPAAVPTQSPPSGCPMHEANQTPKQVSGESGCPMREQKAPPSECPMHVSLSQQSEEIDPTNMMPPPNQRPSPGQPFELSTERVVSNIPKGGDSQEKWVYPSQQMFWNAMLKKGWRWEKDALSPEDMGHIINMHNANNERAWEEVKKWEAFHNTDSEPKLMKFGGKAKEFSPRARIRALFGYDLPFDRHDWVVDRNGKQVRYIIDYYDVGDENGYKTGDFVELDVRPAFDSFGAAVDRSRAAALRWAAGAIMWWRHDKNITVIVENDNSGGGSDNAS